MTYFFETYGCQMNKAESAAIEEIFLSRGWKAAANAETADLAVINTCSVRATAENRVFGRLGWFGALKAVRSGQKGAKTAAFPEAARARAEGRPPLTVAVTGCMAERLLKSLQRRCPSVDYVVGNFQKARFEQIAQAVEAGRRIRLDTDERPAYSFAPLSHEKGSFSAFVPIMHGCNNFCTFCIVPYVRGREISRPVSEILSELDLLNERGVKEITLLGQNVNSYRFASEGGEVDFPALMRTISSHLKETASSIQWVRFMSSHPRDLSDDLIEAIAADKRLCRHVHLPVQHGSDRVLKAMNRRYTRSHYLSLVDKIRKGLSGSSLTTDILIGFPGETEEDFEQTLDLMREVRYDAAYMYYYNPREGTPAASFADQIPIELKKERLQRVIDLQLGITRAKMAERVGESLPVLAESLSRDSSCELVGRTERDERVVVGAPSELIGSFISVHISELAGNTFRGTLVQG